MTMVKVGENESLDSALKDLSVNVNAMELLVKFVKEKLI